jgi:hypothetical protein
LLRLISYHSIRQRRQTTFGFLTYIHYHTTYRNYESLYFTQLAASLHLHSLPSFITKRIGKPQLNGIENTLLAMEHQQPQPRQPLEQAQLDALWKACDSDDTVALAHLVEISQATPSDLAQGFWSAIDHSHPNMMRYLLEQGVDHVDGYVIQSALKVGSIPVLEVLREHCWDDIDMKLDGVALSALLYAIFLLI